ncbi:MAG: hypothetical protein ACOC23_10030 [Thermodesulfobacteriota bacterium]
MRKIASSLLIIVLFTVLFTVLPFSESIGTEDPFSPYVEEFTDGRIDWDNGVIFGTGRGYLHLNGGSKQLALRAAQTAALQSILKIAAGLRLNDRETLKELGGGRIVLQLQALIRYQEEGSRFHKDAEKPYFEVTRRANLKGIDGLTTNLLDYFQKSGIPWKSFPQPIPKQEKETEAETETWLVLNAGGTDVQPALFPRILDETGKVIYEVDEVHQAALEEHGMARYVESEMPVDRWRSDSSALEEMVERVLFSWTGPSQAFAEESDQKKGKDDDRRRKRRKYVVKDVKAAEGLMKTNLVISESDARDLKKQDASSQILKKCRVIIVVNSPLGGVEGMLDFRLAGLGG